MNKNFANNSGVMYSLLLFLYQEGIIWIFIVFSAISIFFIFITPFFIIAQVFLSKWAKRTIKTAYQKGVCEFSNCGCNVSHELKTKRVQFLIDMEKKKFAYWWIGLKDFQPGIADFSEVTDVILDKKNDVVGEDAMGHLKRNKGAIRMVINFKRFDQPTFEFPIANDTEGNELLQKLKILMNAA